MKFGLSGCLMVFVCLTLPNGGVGGFLGIPDFVEAGVCVEVPAMKHFDPVKYQGLWFDIRRVPHEFQESYYCISQNYTWTGSSVNVISRGLKQNRDEDEQLAAMTSEDPPVLPPEENDALMYVDAAGIPRAPYQVTWTDYVTTACVFSCMDYVGMFKIEFMWILSRSEQPTKESVRKCLRFFTSYTIDISKMMIVEQGETCNYGNKVDDDRKISERFLEELRLNISMEGVETPEELWENTPLYDEIQADEAAENGMERVASRTRIILGSLLWSLIVACVSANTS